MVFLVSWLIVARCGWLLVALYLILSGALLGRDYAFFMGIGMLIAWTYGDALFGGEWVGAFGVGVALTVALVGWGENWCDGCVIVAHRC